MYPQPGEIVEGKYRIDKMLGEGAMGGVFVAFHTLRRANVALKFMSEQASRMAEAVDRFMNEAISASQIESDHVVKIFDVGRWGQLPYIVMEHLEGRDLSNEIEAQTRTREPMPVARAVHFTLQILRALQVAHARGIVHRDLKPANAFVINKDGEPDFVKLLDFGISKQTDPGAVHLTKTNVSMGTPLYMAPEQAKSARDADARSDMYSVACILFELLTGRPPHEADNYNLLLFKLFQEDPPHLMTLRPDCPPGLADVVHRGLAKDVSTRVQSASEFAALLAPFADGRSAALLSRMLARTGDRPSYAQGPVSLVPTTGLTSANIAQHREPPQPAQARTAGTGQPPVNVTAGTALAFTGTGGESPAAAPRSSPVPMILGGLALVVALGVGAIVLHGQRAPDKPAPAAAPAAAPTAAIEEATKKPEPKPVVTAEPTTEAKPAPVVTAAVTATAAKKPAAATVAAATVKASAEPTATAAPTAAPTAKKTLKGMDIMK